MRFNYGSNKKGFVAIVSVLVIGAIGVTVSVSLLLFGIASIQNGSAQEESAGARYMADSCAEYALQRLLEDPSYQGGETLDVDGRSCEVLSVTTIGEGIVEFRSIGYDGDAVKNVLVRTEQLRPYIVVGSWQEVE